MAGIAFPLPIMALVPLRRYLLPRAFSAPHLADLDADELLRAQPLDSQQLRLFGQPVAAEQEAPAAAQQAGLEGGEAAPRAPGGVPQRPAAGGGRREEEEEEGEEVAVQDAGELLERQFVGQQVVHELTQAQLAQREQQLRRSLELPL